MSRRDNDDEIHMDDLTRAYHFFWDRGRRVPADLAARLIERGIDITSIESNL